MHEVLVNRLGGLSLSRKSLVRLTDRPDMTLDVYHGRKTTIQQQKQQQAINLNCKDAYFFSRCLFRCYCGYINLVNYFLILSLCYLIQSAVALTQKTFGWASMIPLSHLSFMQCEQVNFRR